MPPLNRVAEADPLRRDVLAESLAMKGYQLRCAGDDAEALTLAVRAAPDVVVSTVAMPRFADALGWDATGQVASWLALALRRWEPSIGVEALAH